MKSDCVGRESGKDDRQVGQVGSQSRPGTSVGLGKIKLCKLHNVSKGAQADGI